MSEPPPKQVVPVLNLDRMKTDTKVDEAMRRMDPAADHAPKEKKT